MSDNQLYWSALPKHKKVIVEYANDKHWSGTVSGCLKIYGCIISRLCEAGIGPERILDRLDKIIEICQDDQED